MQRYEDLRSGLKTGDILLFAGRGGMSSWIKWFTRSPWSHVGMVVREQALDSVFVWESTTLNDLKDMDTNVPRKGVQLVGLRERVMGYDGEIAVRPLSRRLSAAQLANLGRLRSRLAGRPYERSKVELLKAAADMLMPPNREDLTSVFCSELVAEAYQAMGLLGEDRPSNEYTPADFGSRADPPMRLRRGFALGDESFIKPDRPCRSRTPS